MKNLLLLMALSLPIMAQQTETDKEITKQEQRENRTGGVVSTLQDWDFRKYEAAHSRAHEKNGRMQRIIRSDDHKMMGKRIAMAKRKKIQKKRAFRSAVRMVVIGGIAYYVGLEQGKKHRKDGKGKKPMMWVREDKK